MNQNDTQPPPPDLLGFLAGGGEMGRFLRSMDWSRTPLGPVEAWPQSLRPTVNLCLASNFPINIIWGPRHAQIYNDGYWPLCGGKHPRSMRQDFTECWASATPVIGGAFDSAPAGHAAFLENQRMFLDRNGYLEETFFTFSFNPIRDESGGVCGVFHPVTETTPKILSERRTRALRDLSARAGKAKSVEEALALSAETLAEDELGLPFVLFYALAPSGQQARLVRSTGIKAGTEAAPEVVDMGVGDSVWPLGEVARSGLAVQVDDVERRAGPSPYGPYPEPPKAALLLPVTPPGADRRKDEFLATLAHELRNPLAPLRNGLQVVKLAGGDAEAVEQARSMMERQLGQVVHLINDLMDLSRISRGKVELRKGRVELAGVVRQAVETSRPLIEDRGHEFALELPPDPIFVEADVTRLAQVFTNLLNNAAKYTERGGRIRLSVERQGSDAVVSVRDNGIGIPAPRLPKVFDIFSQVDRSLEKAQGGLGIGLSIVKKLVEMHGGGIEAKSDGHGTGSEFTVRLPVVPSSAREARITGGDGATDTGSSAKRRILVADDNVDAASSLAVLLGIVGNEARTANDGLTAIEAAAFRPDVILMDIGMPKLNGYEACRRIRAEAWGKGVVLVACTGWGQEVDKQRSKEAGFDAHMVKPVGPAALERLLASLTTATA